ncbi:AAA family ATPase [Primorskyibacter flagellatus]|uniref:MoxR-like ATPase n=1 Tax=Primorskyibacter flagellatus TaxID=1387277 RepID=A0A1W2A4I3_9RHOB|nr:MoxR-like ATPase [Primorskyibacter flagellatus]
MDALPNSPPENMRSLLGYLSQGLVGHERLIERLMISLLTGGHLLLEGPPGLAKTRAVKWLSNAVEGSFARIQCTPDLMPADLTGTPVFRPQTGTFEFVPGPVFHNLVLVDEINRAPPKVQSALLEAMAEGQVTAGNQTHALPDPFLVVATQNPIEHDGTFPLPEAQLDRFLLYVNLDLPDAQTERQILDLVETEAAQPPVAAGQMPLAALQEARRQAMAVHLSPELRDYIVRLVTATRKGELAAEIEHAVSPRGSLALAAASKARAYLRGRDYALPEDVADLAGDTMAHRMVLSWRAVAEGRSQRDVVATILGAVEAL